MKLVCIYCGDERITDNDDSVVKSVQCLKCAKEDLQTLKDIQTSLDGLIDAYNKCTK